APLQSTLGAPSVKRRNAVGISMVMGIVSSGSLEKKQVHGRPSRIESGKKTTEARPRARVLPCTPGEVPRLQNRNLRACSCIGRGGDEPGVEIGFERVQARGDGFGLWELRGDGIGGLETISGNAHDRGFVGADPAVTN